MPIHVMVGVVFDGSDRALIAQRTADRSHAGSWEFPGGKLEPCESRVAALARELREELGISIKSPRPLLRVTHDYPYGRVLLDVWVVRSFAGIPQGLDGQSLRWCPRRELVDANLLPADEPIISALALPEQLLEPVGVDYRVEKFGSVFSTKERGALIGILCATSAEAQVAAREGADFLALHAPMPTAELIELCESVAVPIFASGIELEAAWAAGATGVTRLRP